MTPGIARTVRLLIGAGLFLVAATPARGQTPPLTQLNENCTVSVLNRNVRVNPDGSWVLPNVPANFGFVRARATCIIDGQTISGESDPFLVPANGIVNLPTLVFNRSTPIPLSLTVTAPAGPINSIGGTVQLTVTARYSDGSETDVSASSAGTQYLVTNPAIATVSTEGLVKAVKGGAVFIQATNEGATGMTSVQVILTGIDTDGDGMPDDYEIAHGFDPNNPIDAQEDPDRDGLTNLQEFLRGTDPRNPDTDGDGLKDGDEVARGTNPLLWDTDGDGISDGLEVQTGSNPLDPASQNLSRALASIRVTPPHFSLTFNTVVGEASVQLTVIGTLLDGRTIDLTSAGRGTNYTPDLVAVCSFGGRDGQVFAGASGVCTITVTSNTFTTTATGDVTNFAPTALGSVGIPGYANNVDVNGHFAYVAAGSQGLIVVDASNPAAPQIVGSVDTPGNADDVRVVGNLAYVADGPSGLQIIDVTDPAHPRIVGAVDTPGDASDVIVAVPFAYIADGSSGLQIIDVSDPTKPKLVRSVATPGTARGVDVDVARSIVVVVSDFPVPGLQVVDVSNPSAPKIAGQITLDGQPTDVSLGKGYAYVADYTGGVRVVDVRQPATPVVVGRLSGDPNDPVAPGFVPRDVQFAGQFAIFAEQVFANAIAPIVDVSDPTHPRFRAFINFGQDYAGTGIAVSGPYVYWTGQSFFVGSENGTDGTTRLFIGQYLALEDRNGVPPTVSIASPLNGASVIEGTKVTVHANAADDVAVASVTFMVNGQEVFLDTSEPYEYTFTVPSDAGTLVISAVATDLGNNTSTAQDVTVSVVPDPGTTVVGRVVDPQGAPIEGVTLTALSHTALSGPDGTFSIPDVPTLQPFVVVSAVLVRNGQTILGTSAPTAVVRGDTTDVGDITATATTFEMNLGTLRPTCDFCDVIVPLPFAFPIAGRTIQEIHVNNGYLWTAFGDEIDAICCRRLLTDSGNPLSGVYVNGTLPGRFVVSWYRMTTNGGPGGAPLDPAQTITAQVILFADGRLQLGYQNVAPPGFVDAALWVSNATNTITADFSAGPVSLPVPESVYESFNPSSHPFDLAGGFVSFAPNAGGGYDIRPVPDVSAPICSVTPANGAVLFEGESIQVVANVTDNGAVTHVHFQSATNNLDVDLTSGPYQVPLVVPVGATGITFNVTAFDSWGNTGTCASTVSVVPGPPPTVTITSVAAGATLVAGATVPIAIDATNRVPVTRVDFTVNGVALSSDVQPPFEFLFTVPSGVATLALSAMATDSVGKTGTSQPLSVAVTPDPLTTVQGLIVDKSSAPIAGADVTAKVRGATVEVFNSDMTLTGLPNVDGRTPDTIATVSAINLRNPGAIFGADPFGLGTSASRAMRMTATLKTIGASSYTFKLGVKAGGRLIVNGVTVVDLPTDTGQFQEGTGTIAVTQATLSIEILTFDNGNPEVQLSYAVPGESELEVVPTSELTPTLVPYHTTSQADGAFTIPGVPTALGAITVTASKTVDGRTGRAHSAATQPVPGGATDVGTLRLFDFGTLYGASFNGPSGPASLYTIDPTTGGATLVGPIGFWRVGAIDVSADGTMYAIGRDLGLSLPNQNVLLTIDPATGAGTEIGRTGVESLGFGDTIADISFRPSDGVLFGYLEARDGLGTINLATGAATALGRTFVSCCGNGMAFASDGRLLHANESALHVLDQTSGVATVLVPLTYPRLSFPRIASMKFQPDTGQLFGFMKTDSNNGTYLVQVDIASGAVSIVGPRTLDGLDAIAWGPGR